MHSLYPLAGRMKTYNIKCVRVANEACARVSELSSGYGDNHVGDYCYCTEVNGMENGVISSPSNAPPCAIVSPFNDVTL